MAKAEAPDVVATEAEVEAAIRALTAPQLLRLEKYARWRVRTLGSSKSGGQNHVDLLGEAVMATLDPERRAWKKGKVDFVWHLRSTMKSLSSHWGHKKRGEIAASLLEREDEDGQVSSVLDAAATTDPSPDETLESAEEFEWKKRAVEAIEKMFEGDKIVSEVVEGIKAGMTGPEIREVLGLSQTEYETAMKRLRRRVRKEIDWSANYD
jgi:hypothetical protein